MDGYWFEFLHLKKMNFSYFISIFIALTISLTVESGPLKSPYRLSPIVRRIISTKLAPGAIGPYNQVEIFVLTKMNYNLELFIGDTSRRYIIR